MGQKGFNQTGSYIPTTDAGFRDWLNNFSTLISADPSKYGLESSDAVIIANLFTSYDAAYQTVQSPSTRTPNAVGQKDAIKASATASCRVYAQIIKTNLGVDNNDKIALGIHVDDTTPSPIPAPVSAPLLNIQAAFSGEHVLRFADENTPDSKRKPAGVTQMELYVHVGPQPIVNWQDATFVGVFTKNPIRYSFEPAQAGAVASYFARWRTAKGLPGPMSLGVAMIIAFGGPVEQQLTITGGGSPQAAPAPGIGDDDQELKIAA